MTDTPAIDAKSAAFFEQYQDRPADMDEIFARSARVTQEALRRVETSMFSGMQYIEGELPPESLLKAVKDLGKVINEAAAVKLRIDKDARTKAAKLTIEEKIEQVVAFVQKLPPTYRAKLLKDLSE